MRPASRRARSKRCEPAISRRRRSAFSGDRPSWRKNTDRPRYARPRWSMPTKPAAFGIEHLVEQALADAERRDRDLGRPAGADDLLEHDRPIGEERAPRLG